MTDIEICNGALLLLSEDTINNLEDASTAGKLCKNHYARSRDAVLRMHPWNFAVKRITLAKLSTPVPAFEYASYFQLPTDCLRLLSIYNLTDYKIEGRKIISDATSINIRYVYRNVTVDEYDVSFVETLSAYLAFKFAYPITKDKAVQKAMGDLFITFLKYAKAVDAQEEPQDTIGDFPLINARRR